MAFQSVRKTLFKPALKAACAVLTLAGAQAATYYVSTTGSDSNSGTQSAPFQHVSRGAAAAHAGDTVIVLNGTYDNEGKVADSGGGGSVITMTNAGSPGNPITIMAQNRGGAILNAASTTQGSLGCAGAWAYFDLSYTSYVVIQGFVIENACVNAFHANATAHDITIRWNEIRNIGNWNNPASTLSPTGIYLNPNEYNFTFDGNIWHDIGGGTNVNQQHAIYSASSNITIVNNIFYNQVHGWDIQTAGGRNIYIANNTFAFPNPHRDGHIVLWDDGIANSLSNVLIENNVFYQPQNYAVVTALSGGSIGGCTIQYNLTTAGTTYDSGSPCSQTSNLTSTDPKFANPSSAPYDFHVQAGSPAIGSGMMESFTTVDFDNSPRGNPYDRGSYQYHSAPVQVPVTISVSANPGSVTLPSGGSATSSIVVSVTGSASPSFSISGLPSGVSASFSPSSCAGSCTTMLKLTASSSTSPSDGTTITSLATSSTATVTASSAAASSSAAISVTVQPASVPPPPPPPPPVSPAGDYASGLAAEWKLLGDTHDMVNNANGSLRGGASFAAAPSLFPSANPALLLNGASAYVIVPEASQLEMTNQLTVAFWAYSDPSPTSNTAQRLIAKVYDWDIKLNGVSPQFSGAGRYAMMNYSFPIYTWTHIVFTFSNGTVQGYVNGQPVSFGANTFTSGTTLPNYHYGLYLGTDSSVSNFFAGSLSDVRIYNRVLSGADVGALYSARASAILQ